MGRDGTRVTSSGLEPQTLTAHDFDMEWAKLRNYLDKTLDRKLDRHSYTDAHSIVYKICIARPEPMSSELYSKLSDYMEEKTHEIAKRLDEFQGEKLLEAYGEKWQKYQKATGEMDQMFQYLNKNHIDQRRYDNVEVHMVDNNSVDNYLKIKDLGNEKWRLKVLETIDEKLVTACLQLIRRRRLGEEIELDQKEQVKGAVHSFIDVCNHKARNKLELYEQKFEGRFLVETSTFYEDQARLFHESGDVGLYMDQVLKVLEDEDRQAFELLARSTMEKQKVRIEKSLIYDGLEFLFEEAKLMVRKENDEQLQKLYKLFKDMEAPLARLVKMFKTYVEEIGIEKIQEAKTAKDFVDLVCLHYDRYKRFVDNVFVSDPGVEFRRPFDELDSSTRDLFQPDKNFLESLKDAMRTIVNFKEKGAQRARAPDLLAQYSDQLLKKRGGEDIDSKLEEIKKCLEFVSEKDLFQANYTRRLAKRLIYGHSSSNDAERQMIEKLKDVCVYDFTSKIKRMYDDITNSAIQQEEYNRTGEFQGIDVKVLQDGSWPFNRTQPSFNLPPSLEPHITSYAKFYEDKHKNRTLKWMYTMSQADVKTVATTKLYLLHVTTFQLGILLIFNEQDQCSFKELVNTTGLDAKEVMKQLKPIVENEVLKVYGEGEVSEYSTLIPNDDFSRKGTKVKLVPYTQRDKSDTMSERDRSSVIKLVDEDRRYWLQACIARVMKKLKQATFNELVTQINIEAGRRFQPSIPMIKKSIESLLEKSFIEQGEGSTDNYLYVA